MNHSLTIFLFFFFNQSLEIHQTFYSNPSLVLAALSTLLALVPVIEIKGSLGYYDRFLLLLKFSVIRGLVMNRGGGRIDLTTAYLEIGVRVVNQVGILAAKYLEVSP